MPEKPPLSLVPLSYIADNRERIILKVPGIVLLRNRGPLKGLEINTRSAVGVNDLTTLLLEQQDHFEMHAKGQPYKIKDHWVETGTPLFSRIVDKFVHRDQSAPEYKKRRKHDLGNHGEGEEINSDRVMLNIIPFIAECIKKRIITQNDIELFGATIALAQLYFTDAIRKDALIDEGSLEIGHEAITLQKKEEMDRMEKDVQSYALGVLGIYKLKKILRSIELNSMTQ
jgi:hypothetical protein